MHITVGICTRDRGASILATLHSLMTSTYHDFDIVIVDQSSTDESESATRAYLAGSEKYTYLRSVSQGASAAHNLVAAHAGGPIIAFTDDCEVSREWLALLAASFQRHPDVGQICGSVYAGPHDSSAGFIPTHHITKQRKIASPWLKWREGGIGANTAFRLAVLRKVGPFDEMLGSGAPFAACLDGDMTYRVLRAGFAVLSVHDLCVIHHGFRTYAQGQKMMQRMGRGVAAAYMKHLRLGDPAIIPTLIAEWLRCITWSRLLRLHPPIGLHRFLAYTAGIFTCYRYPIDRATRCYRPLAIAPASDLSPVGHPIEMVPPEI